MVSQPIDEEFQQGFRPVGALGRDRSVLLCHFLQKIYVFMLMMFEMARVYARSIHEHFFFLEMILGVGGQLAEYLFNIVEGKPLRLRQQFAELVDDINEMVMLLINFRQTGDKMIVPDE